MKIWKHSLLQYARCFYNSKRTFYYFSDPLKSKLGKTILISQPNPTQGKGSKTQVMEFVQNGGGGGGYLPFR